MIDGIGTHVEKAFFTDMVQVKGNLTTNSTINRPNTNRYVQLYRYEVDINIQSGRTINMQYRIRAQTHNERKTFGSFTCSYFMKTIRKHCVKLISHVGTLFVYTY